MRARHEDARDECERGMKTREMNASAA